MSRFTEQVIKLGDKKIPKIGDYGYKFYHQSCEKKRRYFKFEIARNASISMRNLHKKDFKVYKCEFCQTWHVGGTKNGHRS